MQSPFIEVSYTSKAKTKIKPREDKNCGRREINGTTRRLCGGYDRLPQKSPSCNCDEGAMISRSRVRCRKSLDALYAIYRLIIAGNSFTRCSSLSLTRHFFACRAPSFLA